MFHPHYYSNNVFDGDVHISTYKITIHKILGNRCEPPFTLERIWIVMKNEVSDTYSFNYVDNNSKPNL
jgi:hypothetical protein